MTLLVISICLAKKQTQTNLVSNFNQHFLCKYVKEKEKEKFKTLVVDKQIQKCLPKRIVQMFERRTFQNESVDVKY